MSARDDLAKVIFASNRSNTQIDLQDDRRLKGSQLAWTGYAADALLAAGYRKPRTITTVEEMEALPVRSVVIDREGMALQKTEFNLSGTGWNASNGTRDIEQDELERDCFPATVLYEPAS